MPDCSWSSGACAAAVAMVIVCAFVRIAVIILVHNNAATAVAGDAMPPCNILI